MWHLVGYSVLVVVVGIASFVALKYFQARREQSNAEKAACEAGLTPEERQRLVNEALFTPTQEEMIAHALVASRKHSKQQTGGGDGGDNIRAPQGFFVGAWVERLHILYFEAILAERGIREHAALYDAGLDTFTKRRDALEKLVHKYHVVHNPGEFQRNFRLAQEYLEPILLQMCARPNADRGLLNPTELEAFADAMRLAYNLCPGSWRGLAELVRFFSQDMATEDLLALSHGGKRAVKAAALRPVSENDHKTRILMNTLAKTAVARISRKCSFAEAATRPPIETPEWDAMWRKPFNQASASQPKRNAHPDGVRPFSLDQRRLCSYFECFEVEGRRTTNGEDDDDDKPQEFRRCSKCKYVAYCSVECQAKHWKAQHKNRCAALAKQTAAKEAALAAAAQQQISSSSSQEEAKVVTEIENKVSSASSGGLKARKNAKSHQENS